MKTTNFEAKSHEEAMIKAEETLRVNRQYIKLDMSEKRSLFGLKKHFEVTASIDVNLLQMGHELIENLLRNMGIDKVDINSKESKPYEFSYVVNTSHNPVIIGKNGRTLESIQFYIRNLLNIFTDERVIVLVDVGGYKANRKKQLEILATKTAKEVARSKVAVKLDPMNAYERRIIHTKLSEWRDVSTKSEGEKNERYLVIKPKKS